MSKKTFILFLIFILAVFAVLGWYFIFRTPTQNGTGEANNPSNLFPFGQKPPATQDGGQIASSTPIATTTVNLGGEERLPRLRQISNVPTAGAVAFDSGESVLIRYMERATGHIYETESSKSPVTKISNVTIPKIHEALWSANGSKFLIRYLKDDQNTIRTFTARISTTSSADKAIEGSFLPDNIQSVAVNGDRIFYMDETPDGARGIRANMDGTGKTALFDSSFGDWTAVWGAKDILLYPRPSAAAVGGAYLLDSKSGGYVKKLGGINGLAAISNQDASRILYSGKDGKYFGTAIIDPKKGSTAVLDTPTLAEKCAWSKLEKEMVYCAVPRSPQAGSYPDDWYKGKISFSDSIWKISALTGETQEIVNPILEGADTMDIIKLSLDEKEKILLFTNKKDMTVWRYEL